MKWKIFTNKNRTRFVASCKDWTFPVYDGPSEIEALRAILKAVSNLEVVPVEREWVEQDIGEYEKSKSDYSGKVINLIRTSNWYRKYEDNQ